MLPVYWHHIETILKQGNKRSRRGDVERSRLQQAAAAGVDPLLYGDVFMVKSVCEE